MTNEFVYLVWAKNTNRFKIGRSQNPHIRLLQMQTGSPYELELIAEIPDGSEFSLHRQFADFRVKGEWFEIPMSHWGPLLSAFSVNPALVNALVKGLSETYTAGVDALFQVDRIAKSYSTACQRWELITQDAIKLAESLTPDFVIQPPGSPDSAAPEN